MSNGSTKGNNPELWQKLLSDLDEKLQLGLLDKLRRIHGYHFEGDILFIEAGSDEDETYLSKPATLQHLEVLAQDATRVRELRIKKRT
jgi:hypothetical protein